MAKAIGLRIFQENTSSDKRVRFVEKPTVGALGEAAPIIKQFMTIRSITASTHLNCRNLFTTPFKKRGGD
jgi:hypothetical protein